MSSTRTPASGSLLFPIEAALLPVEDDILLNEMESRGNFDLPTNVLCRVNGVVVWNLSNEENDHVCLGSCLFSNCRRSAGFMPDMLLS